MSSERQFIVCPTRISRSQLSCGPLDVHAEEKQSSTNKWFRCSIIIDNKTVDKKICRTHGKLNTPEPMNTYYVNSQLGTNLRSLKHSYLKGRLKCDSCSAQFTWKVKFNCQTCMSCLSRFGLVVLVFLSVLTTMMTMKTILTMITMMTMTTKTTMMSMATMMTT